MKILTIFQVLKEWYFIVLIVIVNKLTMNDDL